MCLLTRAPVPFVRLHTHDLITSQSLLPQFLTPSHGEGGLGFQHTNFGGGQHTFKLQQRVNNLCVKTHELIWKKKGAAEKDEVENCFLRSVGEVGGGYVCTSGGSAQLAVMGRAGTSLGLTTGRKELLDVFPQEGRDPRLLCLGTSPQAVQKPPSRALLATLGCIHGHHFWEQESDWLALSSTPWHFVVGRQPLEFVTTAAALER